MLFFLILIQSLFVIYINIRLSNFNRSFLFYKEQKLTKIGILLICFHLINILIFLKLHSKIVYYLMLFLPGIFFYFLNIKIKKMRESRLIKDFFHFLNSVSISMNIGKSFRVAAKESLHILNKEAQQRVSTILEAVVFSQQQPLDLQTPFESKIYEEFMRIDQISHKPLHRIGLWIRDLEKQSDFRHKSGQVLHQLYIQALILSCMYFALFVFVVKNYGFLENKNVIVISVLLFSIGLFISFKVGKKVKWKF